MNKNLLVTGPGFTQRHLSSLKSLDITIEEVEDKREVILERISDCSAFLLGGDVSLDAEALLRAERLKAISFVGTGISEFVDCEVAQARGVRLFNTPGVMAPAVAEHALGMLLATQRGLFRDNEWVKGRAAGTIQTTQAMQGSTVGIVGWGPIGQRLATLLQALGCRVLYWTRSGPASVEHPFASHVELKTLFSTCDSVVLCLKYTPETRRLVGSKLLSRTRKPIHLVNAAAADLVCPEALLTSLNAGHVASAAFDGYWREPLPTREQDAFGFLCQPDSKFIVTPHVAAKTTDAWPMMMDKAVLNLLDFYKEEL
jgi:D-3-phosphoglycerate dehydrogenase / 2-oxoglutarate reductase